MTTPTPVGADVASGIVDRPATSFAGAGAPACCPYYHAAIELIGKRWTGAIIEVLLTGSRRFSEIAHAVPELSDRLLSERMKELEARGLVQRTVIPGPPIRVEYALSPMGRDLRPAVEEIRAWALRWLRPAGSPPFEPPSARSSEPASVGS